MAVGIQLERELARVQVVVLVLEEVHELSLAAEHEMRARLATGEVMDRDDS
jgi:hypothetical protein